MYRFPCTGPLVLIVTCCLSLPAIAQNPLDLPAAPAAAESMVVKRVVFNDVTMGNVPSHTMFIPNDWNATGVIEWDNNPIPYPQPKITVTGPRGEKLQYAPAVGMSYVVINDIGGPRAMGTPPPANLGMWIAEVAKANTAISDVRLVSDVRDPKREAIFAEMAAAQPMNGDAFRPEVHVVRLSYTEAGVRVIEEITATYARHKPSVEQNMRSEPWQLFINSIMSAPEDRFEQAKPVLQRIAQTYLPVEAWWVQMMEVRGDITRQRHVSAMDLIRRRQQMYGQISEAESARFKENMRRMDKTQKDAIDGIWERHDYQDIDGRPVNLTYHYNHVYSNGAGAYHLTNNPLHKPEGTWTEIQPVR